MDCPKVLEPHVDCPKVMEPHTVRTPPCWGGGARVGRWGRGCHESHTDAPWGPAQPLPLLYIWPFFFPEVSLYPLGASPEPGHPAQPMTTAQSLLPARLLAPTPQSP